jgi:protocatechuate 3,4-dioxygenase beta subunit
MKHATETWPTEAVLARLKGCEDPRLAQIMTSLIKHAHAFVREVELTEVEWFRGIEFLTQTGQMCDAKRQEFVLLSDTLGVSMLVDAINHRAVANATESTVLGPFYVAGARELPAGASIAGDTPGEPTIVAGRVLTPTGQPISGALLDVWQTAPNGLYDVQDPNQPEMNLRGKFRTDAQGRFRLRTVKPVSYPIPIDGPVGKLLTRLGRHPYRPAHIHFTVSAPGYRPVTTHVFAAGDPYLESDVVFGVKPSLIVDFIRHDAKDEAAKLGLPAPFYTANYDFGLQPAA